MRKIKMLETVRKKRSLGNVIAIAILLCLALVSSFRSLGHFTLDLYQIQENLGGDKVVHFLMGSGLMMALTLLRSPRSFKSVAGLCAAVVALLSLDEALQKLVVTRDFDLTDLVAGYFGALVTTVLSAAFIYRAGHTGRRRRPDFQQLPRCKQ